VSREERLRKEAEEGALERRQRLVKLGSAAGFLGLVALAVLIVVSQSQTSGGDTSLEGVEQVRHDLGGIPQEGMSLGDPGTKVTLVEFGDLQCPVCKGYAEEILTDVIDSKVRSGKAKIDFRNYTIIGAESTPAAAAALAAGEQNRGWSFVELFYRNQGIENSGYVTDDFLTAIARGAGVPDIAKWNANRKDKQILAEVTKTTEEARSLGFEGTPSFAIRGPGTAGLEALGFPESSEEIESAIDSATPKLAEAATTQTR